MLTYDPAKRITAAVALKHPWITSTKKTGVCLSELKNLSKIQGMTKLQYATIVCLTNLKMSKEEKTKLEGIFKELDTHGNGMLGKAELKNGYIKLGKSEDEAEREVSELLTNLHANPNGYIEYTRNLYYISEYRISGCDV